MAVRIVEGQLPYTGGTGIGIDANKVISVLLRDENNLIKVTDENELYTDLQLADGILPTDEFPVGVTVGRVLSADGWYQSGTMLNFKTTSGDYGRWIYGTDNHIYYDAGTGVWQQIYTGPEVDTLFQQLRDSLSTVAFTGDYNDLVNRPNVPTVNDPAITINQNGVQAGQFTLNQSSADTIDLTDTTYPAMTAGELGTGTDTTNRVVSAKVIADYVGGKIDSLLALGKFLSLWDASTGMPISFPLSTPYTYTAGDYFLVETVDSTTNYKPDGSSYTGTASTVVETDEVEVGDIYIYDGQVWLLQINHGKSVSFANLAGQPSDNTNLASALDDKQDVSNMVTTLSGADNNHYPTAKAVADAISAGGIIKSATAPLNPTAGMFWYDTVNIDFKFYDGAEWRNIVIFGVNASDMPISITDLEGAYEASLSSSNFYTSSYGEGATETVSLSTDNIDISYISEEEGTQGVTMTREGLTAYNDNGQEYSERIFSFSGNNRIATLDDISKVKIFSLSSTNDLTTAQEAYDYYMAGNPIIVLYNKALYVVRGVTANRLNLDSNKESTIVRRAQGDTAIQINSMYFGLSDGTVTSITPGNSSYIYTLETSYNYTTPYTPLYAGSPATKKYVDDKVDDTAYANTWDGETTIAPSKNAVYDKIESLNVVPSGGTQGQVLTQTSGGTPVWANPSGGIENDTTGTTTTVGNIWAGTETEYSALSSYDASTIYYVF